MSTKKISLVNTDELVGIFRQAAIKYEDAISSANAQVANKNARLAIQISDELSSRGLQELLALKKLLNDENARVRSWAAAELWKVSPMEAAATMRKIASDEKGLVQFSAEEFLRQKQLNESH